jgi:hypothetical protein
VRLVERKGLLALFLTWYTPRAGIHYSFTLSAKSANYCRSRWSRTFLVATDLNGACRSSFVLPRLQLTAATSPLTEYSVNATNWLFTSFLEDNDEVVVLRVIEPGSSAHNAWRASMEEAKDEAEGVLAYLMKKNGEHRQVRVARSLPPLIVLTIHGLADFCDCRVRYRSHRRDDSPVSLAAQPTAPSPSPLLADSPFTTVAA